MRRPDGRVHGATATVDLADGLAEFVRAFPVWVHVHGPQRGYPLSWQHYCLGMRHLGLAANREMLRLADATSAGTATPESRDAWVATVRPHSGL